MANVKNLAETFAEEQENFFQSFDQVILDMDGVVWINFKPLPGAAQCINNMKMMGKDVHYATNNVVTTLETLAERLNKGNFNVEVSDIVTPRPALISYLKRKRIIDDIYIIGSSLIKSELKANGFTVVPDPPSAIEETLAEAITHYDKERKIGAVIFDVDLNMSHIKLQKALWYLCNNPDCEFIVTTYDKSGPVGLSGPLIGMHYYILTLEELAGRDFIQAGKPSKIMTDYIIEKYNIEIPNRVLFIGDSIQADMSTAAIAGFQKLLVLSGTDKIENLHNWKYPENYKPDYYVQDLNTLNEIIYKIFHRQISKLQIS